MSSSGGNECDPGAEEEVPVCTLGEALEHFEEMQKVSDAVLGASDPQNCSYSKGYLKRQALYACLTCNPKNAPFFQPAGVCLACSYKCHDGHELVELYTKRNFRCDCGNKKFPEDNPCLLQREKEELNSKNVYSQNFSGLYCTCHRPYPDPDNSAEEAAGSMLQCVVCEDWYHCQHVLPGADEDSVDPENTNELICALCTQKLPFLAAYGSMLSKIAFSEAADLRLDEVNVSDGAIVNGATKESKLLSTMEGEKDLVDVEAVTAEEKSISESTPTCSGSDSSSQDTRDSGIGSMSESEGLGSATPTVKPSCILESTKRTELKEGCGTIWKSGWRMQLCRCEKCKKTYEDASVTFLLDEEDTLEHYEARGQEKLESDMVQAEESFNRQVDQMGRVGQIELVSGFNHMKEALKDFLKEFADNGKVVGEKDVQEFFENLRASKRPRMDENAGF